VEEVVLAHPFKTRLIADAQIKTDSLIARPRHAAARQPAGDGACAGPGQPLAQHVIRQRLFLVRRTQMVRKSRAGLNRPPRNCPTVSANQFGKRD